MTETAGLRGRRRRAGASSTASCMVLVIHRTAARATSRCPRARSTRARRSPQTAVREIAEETGISRRARRPARRRRVPAAERAREDRALLGGRGRRRRDPRSSTFVAQRRDRRAGVGDRSKKARTRLSYPHDVEILEQLRRAASTQGSARTFADHRAAPRQGRRRPTSWDGPDATRPLHAARRRPGARASRPASRAFGAAQAHLAAPPRAASRRSRRSPRLTGLAGQAHRRRSARMPTKPARRTSATVVGQARARSARPPCCAATARCCPRSSTRARARDRHACAARYLGSAVGARDRRVLGRAPLGRPTRARASSRSRRTDRRPERGRPRAHAMFAVRSPSVHRSPPSLVNAPFVAFSTGPAPGPSCT